MITLAWPHTTVGRNHCPSLVPVPRPVAVPVTAGHQTQWLLRGNHLPISQLGWWSRSSGHVNQGRSSVRNPGCSSCWSPWAAHKPGGVRKGRGESREVRESEVESGEPRGVQRKSGRVNIVFWHLWELEGWGWRGWEHIWNFHLRLPKRIVSRTYRPRNQGRLGEIKGSWEDRGDEVKLGLDGGK